MSGMSEPKYLRLRPHRGLGSRIESAAVVGRPDQEDRVEVLVLLGPGLAEGHHDVAVGELSDARVRLEAVWVLVDRDLLRALGELDHASPHPWLGACDVYIIQVSDASRDKAVSGESATSRTGRMLRSCRPSSNAVDENPGSPVERAARSTRSESSPAPASTLDG